MKNFLFVLPVIALVVAAFSFTSGKAEASDPISDLLPPCVLYVSTADVPVSFACAPYRLPNGTTLNAISVNEPAN